MDTDNLFRESIEQELLPLSSKYKFPEGPIEWDLPELPPNYYVLAPLKTRIIEQRDNNGNLTGWIITIYYDTGLPWSEIPDDIPFVEVEYTER